MISKKIEQLGSYRGFGWIDRQGERESERERGEREGKRKKGE